MGYSTYNVRTYERRMEESLRSGTDLFEHNEKITRGQTAAGTHPLLDPARPNSAGKIVRESFDSETHPASVPLAVMFDVTGSMARTPRTFVKELATLMTQLHSDVLPNAHVLIGSVGDAFSDKSPLQVGQFEAGNEVDDVLSKIHLEGNGGAGKQESYELAMYFMARHTDLDSVKKRGKKGYLFLIGDELPYPTVDPMSVKRVIGEKIPAPIPTTTILAELREKFEVFWIFPGQTNNYNDPTIKSGLTKYFGNRVLRLEDPNLINATVLGTVALIENKSIDKALAHLPAKSLQIVKTTLNSLEEANDVVDLF